MTTTTTATPRKTPGQVAYEKWLAIHAGKGGWCMPWDKLQRHVQNVWEEVARAVLDDHRRKEVVQAKFLRSASYGKK